MHTTGGSIEARTEAIRATAVACERYELAGGEIWYDWIDIAAFCGKVNAFFPMFPRVLKIPCHQKRNEGISTKIDKF